VSSAKLNGHGMPQTQHQDEDHQKALRCQC